MRLATLMLTAALALGMAVSGNALARDFGGHGHGYGHRGHAGDVYRSHRHGHRHPQKHRLGCCSWRHAHRPYFRPSWKGRHEYDYRW